MDQPAPSPDPPAVPVRPAPVLDYAGPHPAEPPPDARIRLERLPDGVRFVDPVSAPRDVAGNLVLVVAGLAGCLWFVYYGVRALATGGSAVALLHALVGILVSAFLTWLMLLETRLKLRQPLVLEARAGVLTVFQPQLIGRVHRFDAASLSDIRPSLSSLNLATQRRVCDLLVCPKFSALAATAIRPLIHRDAAEVAWVARVLKAELAIPAKEP